MVVMKIMRIQMRLKACAVSMARPCPYILTCPIFSKAHGSGFHRYPRRQKRATRLVQDPQPGGLGGGPSEAWETFPPAKDSLSFSFQEIPFSEVIHTPLGLNGSGFGSPDLNTPSQIPGRVSELSSLSQVCIRCRCGEGRAIEFLCIF